MQCKAMIHYGIHFVEEEPMWSLMELLWAASCPTVARQFSTGLPKFENGHHVCCQSVHNPFPANTHNSTCLALAKLGGEGEVVDSQEYLDVTQGYYLHEKVIQRT
jgi:hypothetical protein